MIRLTIATFLLGIVLVVMPLPFNDAAAITWLIVIVRHARRSGGELRRRCLRLLIQVALLSIIVVAAIAAPSKTTDKVLSRRVVLPKTQMTFAELREWFEPSWPDGMPCPTSINFQPSDAHQVIHWPSRELSLREFVAAIEAQSKLSAKFRGCGNGWTVLTGNDCSFGLSLRDRSRRTPY